MSAAATHTPGPWTATYDDYGDEIWYGGEGCGQWTIAGPSGVYCAGNGNDPERKLQAEANARLIAAAPTIHEILRKIVAEWDQSFDAEGPEPDGGYRWSSQTAADLIDKARTAIAKAEGIAVTASEAARPADDTTA